MSTTPALTAAQLRKLADALDLADDAPLNVYVGITAANYSADQATRVAQVDAIAGLLDLTAEPTMQTGSYWQHEARDERDGVRLRVHTQIDAPAKRCACGAQCTHTLAGGPR